MERTQSVAVAPPVSASPAPRLRCARVRAGRSRARARAPCRAIPSRLLRATLAPPAGRPSATPRRACAVACASRRFRVRIAATMIGRERNGTERNETDYVHVDRDGSRKRVLLISDNSALFGADALLVSLKFSSGFR
jgi:hypothetical protein